MLKISDYILSNTIWLFLCVVAFQAILTTQEASVQTWSVHFSYFFTFLSMSLPAIVFSFFRKKIQTSYSPLVFWSIWGSVFILFPTVFTISKGGLLFLDIFQYHRGINPNAALGVIIIFNVFFLLIFITELAVQFNHLMIGHGFLNKWLKKINLEVGILSITLLFAVYLVLVNYVKFYDQRDLTFWENVGYFIKYSSQIFLILLVYYPLYLINHYLLVNQILKKHGFVFYLISFIGVLFFFYPITAQLIYYIPIVREWSVHPVNDGRIFSGVNLLTPMFGMIFTIPIILAFQWYKQRGQITALEKEKSETELNLLKQQINPHFFFNTLNNLYALSLKKDEQTPEVILQLSDLMRYVIYKGKENSVRLIEDIDYIEGYIQLQTIRLHKELDYYFEKNLHDPNISIPPLLFIILVENAFKHGIEPAENPCFLHISLTTTEDQLTFICENSYEEENKNQAGIGLENLKRRLHLLYGEQANLKIDCTFNHQQNIFKTTLIIKNN